MKNNDTYKKCKIVFTDYYFQDINKEIKILNKLGNVEIIDCNDFVSKEIGNEEKILTYLKRIKALDADALIVNHAIIGEKIISQLKNCKIIARYGVGVDNIDSKAACEAGIVISNVPDYCLEEVSDNAIAFMLGCQRKIFQLNHILKSSSQWSYEKIKPIRRLSNLTIGLLSFGNIARKVAKKLRGFNLNIITYDPYFSNKEKYNWVKFVTLDELLKKPII
jgi:D-3-phosphoglycerate dehydrogenase